MYLPPEINIYAKEAIERYLNKTSERLPGLIEGFYLYGSITLNDFYPRKSDIDFVSVCAREPSKDDIKILGSIHKRIQFLLPKPNLNGIYITRSDLGKDEKTTKPFPYFHEGKMFSNGYYELSRITWYQLKTCGIAVTGVSTNELNIHIDKKEMLKEMLGNMNTYWKKWVNKHRGFGLNSIAAVLFGKKIEWGVLGVSRQYYTFVNGEITSKLGAGEYCLNKLPGEYSLILNEAIRIRKGTGLPFYKSRIKRRSDMIEYMKYVIDESNKIMA